jgi:hypothetical protein
MIARHPEQEPSLFPVTTAGFIAFVAGGLFVLSLVVFIALWSTPDSFIGSSSLSGWETAAATVALIMGLAATLFSGVALVIYGDRAKVQYTILGLGLVVSALLLSLLI